MCVPLCVLQKSSLKNPIRLSCVGEGCGQVRTSGGVYHSSLKAKPEMMPVVQDDREGVHGHSRKNGLWWRSDCNRNEICRMQQTGCKVSDRIFKEQLKIRKFRCNIFYYPAAILQGGAGDQQFEWISCMFSYLKSLHLHRPSTGHQWGS